MILSKQLQDLHRKEILMYTSVLFICFM